MRYYCEEKDKVLSDLGSREDGLTSEEAARRLAENGKNRLAAKKAKPLILRFLGQLAEPMTIILMVAAAIILVSARRKKKLEK